MSSSDPFGIDAEYVEFRAKVTAACKRKLSDLESENKKLSDKVAKLEDKAAKTLIDLSTTKRSLLDSISKTKELAKENKRLRIQRTKWIETFMKAADEDNKGDASQHCSLCKKGSMTLAYHKVDLKECRCTGSCGDIAMCSRCHASRTGQICPRCNIPGSLIVERTEDRKVRLERMVPLFDDDND